MVSQKRAVMDSATTDLRRGAVVGGECLVIIAIAMYSLVSTVRVVVRVPYAL